MYKGRYPDPKNLKAIHVFDFRVKMQSRICRYCTLFVGRLKYTRHCKTSNTHLRSLWFETDKGLLGCLQMIFIVKTSTTKYNIVIKDNYLTRLIFISVRFRTYIVQSLKEPQTIPCSPATPHFPLMLLLKQAEYQ